MKDMLKNKKIIAIIGSVIILLAIGITCIILNVNKKEDTPIHKEETHNMFVKINPLVKLTFKEEYYLCKNDDEKEICGEQSYKVSGYELINDDAKIFYKDLDFEDKDLYQVLLMLCETARDNNVGFESLEITTDSDNITNKNVLDYLKDNSKYEVNYSVYVNFEEHINEENILKDEDTDNKIYLVTFDSDGGSKVENQIIDKGNKISKPANPTKDGYNFVEWQLDGKTFDFNTELTQDIILKAKWEKNNTQSNNSNTNTETKPNNNNTEKPKKLKSLEAPRNASTVELRKSPSKISATLVDNILITVTITGEKSSFDKYSSRELSIFRMYVDLSSLNVGTHNVKIQLENTLPEFAYKISPETIQVKMSNMSSTIDKINLNDNLLVNITDTGTACGGYEFNDMTIFEIAYNELLQLKSQKHIGIANFNIRGGNGSVAYDYEDISFQEDYGDLRTALAKKQTEFQNKLNSILSKGTYNPPMNCGYDNFDKTLLTQELCNKFNLTCDRW